MSRKNSKTVAPFTKVTGLPCYDKCHHCGYSVNLSANGRLGVVKVFETESICLPEPTPSTAVDALNRHYCSWPCLLASPDLAKVGEYHPPEWNQPRGLGSYKAVVMRYLNKTKGGMKGSFASTCSGCNTQLVIKINDLDEYSTFPHIAAVCKWMSEDVTFHFCSSRCLKSSRRVFETALDPNLRVPTAQFATAFSDEPAPPRSNALVDIEDDPMVLDQLGSEVPDHVEPEIVDVLTSGDYSGFQWSHPQPVPGRYQTPPMKPLRIYGFSKPTDLAAAAATAVASC